MAPTPKARAWPRHLRGGGLVPRRTCPRRTSNHHVPRVPSAAAPHPVAVEARHAGGCPTRSAWVTGSRMRPANHQGLLHLLHRLCGSCPPRWKANGSGRPDAAHTAVSDAVRQVRVGRHHRYALNSTAIALTANGVRYTGSRGETGRRHRGSRDKWTGSGCSDRPGVSARSLLVNAEVARSGHSGFDRAASHAIACVA